MLRFCAPRLTAPAAITIDPRVAIPADYTRPRDSCFLERLRSKSSTEGRIEMKFKVDIDCTPDEARAFFGLPDVKPLQEALMPEVEERLRATLKAMDPEAMLKTWLPATLRGFEQLQQMFFPNMSGPGRKKNQP